MKKFKKLTAGLLGAVMALSVCSFTAFAEDGMVAEIIGDKEYATLKEAIEASDNNATIKLIGNATTDILVDGSMSNGDKLVYDLNGYDLKYTGTGVSYEGATLSFIDSSTRGSEIGGTLNLSGVTSTQAAIKASNGGVANAENINVITNGSVFYPKGDAAEINIKNCNIEAAVYCVGTNAEKLENYGVIINIENSTLTSSSEDGDNTAVLINVKGKLNIKDSKITGDRQAVIARAGEVEIENTEIVVTGSYNGDPVNIGDDWKDGNNIPVGAIVVGNKSANAYKAVADVTIEDCIITSEKEDVPAILTEANEKYSSSIEIIGKDTVVTGAVMKGKNQDKTDIKVVGGSFTSDVSDYMDSESTLVKDKDGKYVVMDKDEIKESTTKFYIDDYDDLKTAIAHQTDGVTWILKDNIDVIGMIFINTDVTIKGNDNTLTFTGDSIFYAGGGKDSFIQIEDGADVTIRDLTIDGDSGVEGSEKVKHGINIFSYEADDQITKVTVDNVKIVDCGGYAITNNASEVVVESLETSGNLWGGINVDNSKKTAGTRKEGAKLTIKDAVINEDNSVYFENENYEAGTKVDAEIKDGEFAGTVAIGDPGATLEITGGDFEGAVGTVAGSDINIVSGTFATDIRDYIDDGSEFIKDKDGNYVVMDEIDSKRPSHSYSLEEGRVDRDDEDKEEPVVTTEPEEEAGPFSDVGKDNPNYDAIIKVYENGWMAGIGDGVFAPNGTLTRGMGAMVLWNKAGCPEPQNVAPFLDVTSDDWYAKAVAWAYEQGIVAGYGDVFGPDDALTTEQFERMSAIANGKTPEIYVGGAPNATRGWVASLLAM